MTNRWTYLFSLVALLISASADAGLTPLPAEIETQLLVTITNDRDHDVSHMALMIGSDEKVQGLYTETENAGNIDENNIYPLNELQSKKGVVIEHQQGRDVLRLQGQVDEGSGRARLTVSYLSNGLFGKYRTCSLTATRDSSGHWQALNPVSGRLVQRVHIVTHALGISKLQGACD